MRRGRRHLGGAAGNGSGGAREGRDKSDGGLLWQVGARGKVAREHVARHGCAAAPSEFWPEAVAVLGSEFDLSLLERVHLGTDGEAWCKRGGACFPLRVEVVGYLDPFHIDRALLSCFDDPAMGWQLIEVVRDGGKEAAALLEACIGRGLARKSAPRVLAYLRNNMGIIAAEGPSLGTMESENQHLYKSRMTSVPCAWTREGASHMARLRSRRGGEPRGSPENEGWIRYSAQAQKVRGAPVGGTGTGRAVGHILPVASRLWIRAAQSICGRNLI